ncbi:HYR-like domain-containing protein [Balneicella halophila]|uniref:HYR-like domain-containing protein n=1 Tax=Balneicella halophila TaxID=1537566 RepID=UPI001403232E|nr:HYR domain-containing protein [Balneicella halophila]
MIAQNTPVCSGNKVSNGSFTDNINGWTLGGNWSRWGLWYGGLGGYLYVTGENGLNRSHELTSTTINNLCLNTPKQIKFKFRYTGFSGAGFFKIYLGSQEIFRGVLVDGQEIYSEELQDVSVNVDGLVLSSGGTIGNTSVRNVILNLSNYTGNQNAQLKFVFEDTSNSSNRRLRVDDVGIYERPLLPPPNPISENIIICEGELANLNSVLPTSIAPEGLEYQWHRVPSSPNSATLVSNPASVSSGYYFLYYKSNCIDYENDCSYSPAALKSVQVLNDIDCDGIDDVADFDDDNDGILDTQELCQTDQEGLPLKKIKVRIDLDTDENETTWELVSPSGQFLIGGGPYEDSDETIELETSFLQENGVYFFTIRDSFGDGLWGTGRGSDSNNSAGYTIYINDVEVISYPPQNQSADFGFIKQEPIIISGINRFSCLDGDPMEDNDVDGVINYRDPDYCTLNGQGVCADLDLDGDGLINSLDPDSDDDGCPDAIEGAADFTEDDLIDDRLCDDNLCVNNQGIPKIADGGQSLGGSQETVDLAITKQPTGVATCPGDMDFKAIATATNGTTNNLTYQWQELIGGTWTDITSANGTVSSGNEAILNLSGVTTSMNGYKYRVVFKHADNPCGIISDEAVLTVYDPVTITTQPQDIITCKDNSSNPSLLVEAEGGHNLTFQWQKLVGGTWTNISGANLTTYVIPTDTPGNYEYRVIISSEGTNCGSLTSNVSNVLVKENPTLTVPDNMTVQADPGECTAVVNYNVTTTGTEPINLSYRITRGILEGQTGSGTGSGISFPEGINVIEITASNGCVDVIKNFTINVEDTQMPTIQCNTSDINLETDSNNQDCNVQYDLPDPTYSDNCTATLSYKIIRPDHIEINGNGIIPSDQMFQVGTSEIIYSVTDAGNNTVSCSYSVTVVDKTPPVLSGCPTQTVQFPTDANNCFHTVLASDIEGVITGLDNCSGINVSRSYEIDNQIVTLPYQLPKGITNVRAIATDEAGNRASCTFDVQVIDDEKPNITSCPPDIAEINGCNTSALANNNLPDYSETRMSVSESIFTSAGGVATDNCPDAFTYQYQDSQTNLSDPCRIQVTRLWYVIDASGNESDYCAQLITIRNQQAPVVPTDGFSIIHCPSELVDPELPVVNDACGNEIDAEFMGKVSNPTNIDCEGTRTYTYQYTDCAGNVSEWKYTYELVALDFIDNMPANTSRTTDCVDDVIIRQPATVYDYCGKAIDPSPVQITPANYADNPCYQGDITFEYTFVDCFGKFSHTYKHTVTVMNDQKPTGVVPDPATYKCKADIPQANVSDITGLSSNCGGSVNVNIQESDNGGEGCSSDPYILTRKYILTDCSGLTNTYTQTITVINDESPTFTSCPGNISEEADDVGGNFAIITIPTPSATSRCGDNATITYTLSGDTSGSGENITNQAFNIGVTNVEYRAIDKCGNQASCTLIVTVRSNEAPEINCPGDIVTSCYDGVPAPYTTLNEFQNAGGTVTDTDGIDASTFTLVSQIDNNLSCPRTIIRTYRIADNNGHSANCAQTIIVDDNIAPAFTGSLSTLSIEGCQKEDEPAPYSTAQELLDNGLISLSDNCTPLDQLDITSSETYSGTCPIVINRIYTIEDGCGNQTTIPQELDINDTTPPTITGTISLIEVQGCTSNDFPNHVESVSELLQKYGKDNGTVQQALEISDNCTPLDQLGLTYSETITEGCPTIIRRTYTIIDKCGNETSISKEVHVIDDEAPQKSGTLRDKNIDGCGISALNSYPPATNETELEQLGITYFDNCTDNDQLVIKHISDNTVSQTDCYTKVIRTYTLSDACSNTLTLSQTITISDNTPPVATGTLSDVSVEGCSVTDAPSVATTVSELEALGLQINDNCSTDSEIVVTYQDFPSGSCPLTIKRFYTIKDKCGNKIELPVQTITVQDTQAPIVEGNFVPFILEGCGSEVFTQASNLTVAYLESRGYEITDCVDDSELIFEDDGFELVSSDDCIKKYIRKGFVVDKCGNKTALQAEVHVKDTTPPVELPTFTIPENQSGLDYCFDDIPEAPEASLIASQFTDTCSSVSATLSGTPTGDDSNWSVTYTYIIKDACGNEALNHPKITYSGSDKTAPVPNQTTLPDIIAQCATSVTAPTANDACYGTVTATTTNPTSFTQQGTYYINWKYTDGNGNEAYQTQKVIIKDTTAPEITCPVTESVYYENEDCNAELSFQATASDNCTSPTISYFIDDDKITFPYPFTVGTTKVIVKADDGNGNTNSCSFQVKVEDNSPPSITCPIDKIVDNDPGQCSATVDIGNAVASDNCGIASVTNDAPLDRDFPIGTSTVTWTTIDVNGNTNTCTQFIIVEDGEKPTYDAPNDVSYCVNNIIEANYANTTNGDVNTPPDYYEFGNADLSLDLNNVDDNCCVTNTIIWSISPEINGATVSGTGQPSDSIEGIRLWLDVATENPKSSYVEKEYTITYVVVDCNGNSTQKTTQITIKPRPKIIKVNN